ncbi:MAG: protein phosphatase 2C domain-containing protein [Anaerolineae bacterium]
MTPFHLTYGLTSAKGTVRETNQDVAAARLFKPAWSEDDVGLFMVADGMGARGEGERAAQIAVDTVIEAVTELMSNNDAPTNIGEFLTEAFKKANATILSETPDGGTTLTCALVIGNKLHIAHVGDTRAYVLFNNEIILLTKDHTFSMELVRLGHVTTEELKLHPIDDVLFRALGRDAELEVDMVAMNLTVNSSLLLCTDGLIKWSWGFLSESQVTTIIHNCDPQTASDRLVALARERGSNDDITALVVRVG